MSEVKLESEERSPSASDADGGGGGGEDTRDDQQQQQQQQPQQASNKSQEDRQSPGDTTTTPTRPTLLQPGAPANFCNICNKELCNKYFMKTHMQKMHGINLDDYPREAANSGGVVCDICQKELCSKYFLKVHKSNTHGVTEFASGPAGAQAANAATAVAAIALTNSLNDAQKRAALNLALNQHHHQQQQQQHHHQQQQHQQQQHQQQQQQQQHQQQHQAQNRKRHRGEQQPPADNFQQQQALLNAAVFNPTAAAAAAMMAIQHHHQQQLQQQQQQPAMLLNAAAGKQQQQQQAVDLRSDHHHQQAEPRLLAANNTNVQSPHAVDLRSTPLHQLLLASRLNQHQNNQHQFLGDCSELATNAVAFANSRATNQHNTNRPGRNATARADRLCPPDEAEADEDLYSDHDSYDEGPPAHQAAAVTQTAPTPLSHAQTFAASQALIASAREHQNQHRQQLGGGADDLRTSPANLLALNPFCSNPAFSVIAAAAAATGGVPNATSRPPTNKKKRISPSPHPNAATQQQQQQQQQTQNNSNGSNSASNNNRYLRHYTEACPICDRRFKSIKWLQSHVMNDHKNEIGNLFNLLVQMLICGSAAAANTNGTPSVVSPLSSGSSGPLGQLDSSLLGSGQAADSSQETNTGNANLIGNLIAAQLLAQQQQQQQQRHLQPATTTPQPVPPPPPPPLASEELNQLDGGNLTMGTLASLIGLQQQIQSMQSSNSGSIPVAQAQPTSQQQQQLVFGALQQQPLAPLLAPLLAPHLSPGGLQRLMQQQQQQRALAAAAAQSTATQQSIANALAAGQSAGSPGGELLRGTNEYMKFISSDNE